MTQFIMSQLPSVPLNDDPLLLMLPHLSSGISHVLMKLSGVSKDGRPGHDVTFPPDAETIDENSAATQETPVLHYAFSAHQASGCEKTAVGDGGIMGHQCAGHKRIVVPDRYEGLELYVSQCYIAFAYLQIGKSEHLTTDVASQAVAAGLSSRI